MKEWAEYSEPSIQAKRNGGKNCRTCGEFKPVEEFYTLRTRGKLARYASDCMVCYRKKVLEKYHQNKQKKEALLEAERKRYAEKKETLISLILDQDECDVCGEPRADWYYKKTTGRAFDNWMVLHRECKPDAVAEGFLSWNAELKPKIYLQGTIPTNSIEYFDIVYPDYFWSPSARQAILLQRKTCTKCKQDLPLDKFTPSAKRKIQMKILKSECDSCIKKRHKRYQARRKAEAKADREKAEKEKNG